MYMHMHMYVQCVCNVCMCIFLPSRNLYQSINQNLCSAPSRSLIRSALDPGEAEKNSLEQVVEIESRFGGALDLLEIHSTLLDQL